MSQILWNTEINAPCCPGEIVGPSGESILIQSDWDYPGVAGSFGWSLQDVQKCRKCKRDLPQFDEDDNEYDHETEIKCDCGRKKGNVLCRHEATDGTVPCQECGLTHTDFIGAAYDWLRENDGATADNPGYFN